jgi:ATP-dependent DNA helicase PIF1
MTPLTTPFHPEMPKVVDTSEAERIIRETLLAGEDVFLTGGAGVGKTYLTNLLLKKRKAKKGDAWNFDFEPTLSAVRIATTAIAASHIGGITIHRFFKLGLSNNLRTLKEFDKRQAESFGGRIGVNAETAHRLLMGTITKNLVQHNVIVIEEISMASAFMIEMIVYRLRECLGIKIPILYVGDFFQLPPVTKSGPVHYAFDSPYWNPKVFELTKVQRTDNIEFAEVLNKIRVGTKDVQVITFFSKLGMRSYDPDSLHLFSTNSEIDNYNIDRLSLLDGKGLRAKYRFNDTEYKEADVLKFIENELIINPVFYFKYGARVIMTSNQYNMDGDLIWFNGESGILLDYVENYFIVKKDNGTTVHVKREVYQRIELKDGREHVTLECHHFPLRVGYAISIHKSQGMSLGQGHVDCSHFFLPEQPYVAFSRFTDPDKLSVSNFNPDLIKVNKRVLAYYESADITTLS